MTTRKYSIYFFTVLMLILAMLACTIPTGVVEEVAEGLAELELFVSTSGSDSNDCQTPTTACRTVVRAVQVANEMDNAIISIAAGTYNENDQAVIRKAMAIRGEGTVTIRHDAPYDRIDPFIVTVEDSQLVRMENFNIENGQVGIRMAAGRLSLENVNFNGLSTRALQIGPNTSVSIQNSIIANTASNALAIAENSVITLRNVSISGSMDTAILNYGSDLTLENVSIFDNSARGSYPTAILHGSSGGSGAPGGELRISNSAIYNNRHAEGLEKSAIVNASIMEVTNSTISGNSGDGILMGRDSQTSLVHVTIASHPGVGLNSWGDIVRTSITLVNTLIVYNGRDCDLRTIYSDAALPDVRNSMDSDNTCLETQSAERAAWDFNPGVLPLADNGGNSPTHALERESPAVDAVSCPLAADQRGVARPQGERCDIGAFELEPELGAPPIGPTNTPLAIVEQTTPNATLPVVPTQVNITATPGPMVRFLTGGNCRTGPGTVYPVVTALQQGAEAPAEGRNNESTWWYILAAPNVRCWVSATVVEAIGPVAGLPALPAPPTPVVSPTPTNAPVQAPNAPAQLYIEDRVCNGQSYTVTLRWLDQSNNEQGFRVYRDGMLIATLSANETKYTDSPAYGGPYTYGIESFNAGGASARQTVIENGCIP